MENTEQKNNNMVFFAVGAAALLLIGGGALFAISRKSTDTNTQTDQTGLVSNATPSVEGVMSGNDMMGTALPSPAIASQDDTNATVIAVEGGSYYYKPNEIRVKQGDKIKINFSSKDMMHDFNIDELGVHMPITRAGSTSSIVFTADKTGTFEYYCSVGNHRKMGQIGKIIVE